MPNEATCIDTFNPWIFFFDNTIQRIIKTEMIYRVSDDKVTQWCTYAAGATYRSTYTVYTGNGTVYFDKMRRPMTDDSYPCSFLLK